MKGLSTSPQVLMQTVGDEAVLLDLRSEKYFGLNPIGTRFWQLLQDGGDLESIRRRLLSEYDVSEDQLRADLDSLVQRLVSAGLVTRGRDA